MQWITGVLVPYRDMFNIDMNGLPLPPERRKPLLLLMDGHRTHCTEAAVQYCVDNDIFIEFFPPHTSHVIQPLDVGVFNSFKAEWRRAGNSPKLADAVPDGLNAALTARMRSIARSLVALEKSATRMTICRSFVSTGIYPLSKTNFLHHCRSIRGVPPPVRQEVDTAIAQAKQTGRDTITCKRRISISETPHMCGQPNYLPHRRISGTVALQNNHTA
jgi:hypothetical protein